MPDPASYPRSRTMSAVRSSNTTPERLLRAALHRAGVRFRLGQTVQLDTRTVRPDLVFRQRRVAVFVDGCFWHRCPEHFRMPASNIEYWKPKIARNVSRDSQTDSELRDAGWAVIRIWEHEDPREAGERVRSALQGS